MHVITMHAYIVVRQVPAPTCMLQAQALQLLTDVQEVQQVQEIQFIAT